MFKIALFVSLSIMMVSCSSNQNVDVENEEIVADSTVSSVVFERGVGSSVRTNLGSGIVVNDKSSLMREWIVAQDTLLPVRLLGNPSPRTVYVSGYYSGNYQYRADFQVQTVEPLVSIEVRFVLFDVWGDLINTLSSTDVMDIGVDSETSLSGRWGALSENEVSEYYASIAFIARARTASGKVYVAQTRPIIEEAIRISSRLKPDLSQHNQSRIDSLAASLTARIDI